MNPESNPSEESRVSNGEPGSGEPAALELLLRCVPFFQGLQRLDVARLVGALDRVDFPAGSLIFAEGAQADSLYLLGTGRIAVSVVGATNKVLAEIEAPACFGELGLLLEQRTGSVHAVTDVTVWKLPRPRFDRVLEDQPAIGIAMARAMADLLDRRSRELAGAPFRVAEKPSTVLPSVPITRSPGQRLAAAGIVFAVPTVLWYAPPPHGLSAHGWHVGLIVLGAALAWLLELVPDFVVALAMATAWGLAGLVPLARAFAGFTSPSYIVALGALGIGAAMARSGLLFRIALLLLKTFPTTYAGQVLALLASGVAVTPLMPLGIGRVATVAPLTQELAEGLGYAERSRGSAGLAFAGILGYGAFSSIFFTGLAMNFYVDELLPPADRAHFGWVAWLAAAMPMGLVILAGSVVLLLVLLRPEQTVQPTADVLKRQQHVLGALSRQEVVTIVSLAVLLLGLIFQPLLHVDSGWLALISLVVALAGGALDRESFRTEIDWGFLILFGVLLGAGGVLAAAGLDQWIGNALVPLANAVRNPSILVMLLGAFVVACRVVLPWIPATLLLSLALVPAASRLGVSPWIVGFVILMAANTWLHPRQSDYYRIVRGATRGEMFVERHGLIIGVGLTALTLAGLALSVPYWRAMGLFAR